MAARARPDARCALTALFREAGRPLLMPYAVGGYPDPASCLRIVDCYLENGADLVELGIPFSDPLADGPVIQGASQVALRNGVRPGDVLDIAGEAAHEGRQAGAAELPEHHPGLRPGALLRPLPGERGAGSGGARRAGGGGR